MINFLFWLFFAGLIIAVVQDVKRREVDNWLNLLLLVSGIAFIVFYSVFINNSGMILQLGFFLLIMFFVSNALYYGRFFAGGDAKLLFAMSALFIAGSFYNTLINLGIFLLFLFIAGSIYGLCCVCYFVIFNFRKIEHRIKKEMNHVYFKYAFLLGVFLFLLGFAEHVFFIPGVSLMLFPFLFIFARAIEHSVMIKSISVRNLREGDWLAQNIKVKGRVIKSSWEGLTNEDIRLIQRVHKVKIKIKDGIAFVPAFLISFLLYVFLKDFVLKFLMEMF